MDSKRYEQIRDVFLEARAKTPPERTRYLAETCGADHTLRSEVESLLASEERAQTFLQTPVVGEGFAECDPSPFVAGSADTLVRPSRSGGSESLVHPERIGPYRILDVLGEGGMGIVYRAQQERPRRFVALKVIRPGIESTEVLKRFEHEGQVLGWLKHPGIAQIYEAGKADTGRGPQPFFAMELVEGDPLIQYATDQGLNVRDRLTLFAKICDAVHHAHQKGILHRDLKPSNILVDASGQPKVLDFGVARATDADLQTVTMHTAVGQLIGTMAYMSPEQVAGDPSELDTQSDVYSLGAVLYQLLAGKVPLDVTGRPLAQAARVIAEQEPEPITDFNRFCRGDIATIAHTALAKEKSNRYASAAALAADIRRYLSDEPIAARPVTTLYQLRKFAQRNKAFVAGILISFVAIVAALVVVTLQRDRALSAERLAEERRERAESAEALAGKRLAQVELEAEKVQVINDFFNDMLSRADPGRDGRDVRVVEVLEAAAANVDEILADQPEILSALQHTIGTLYIRLGFYEKAEPRLREALALRLDSRGEDDAETQSTMISLAAVLKDTGRVAQAETMLRRILASRQRTLGPEDPFTLNAMNNLGEVLQKQGHMDEAVALWSEALSIKRRVLKDDDPSLAIAMVNLAQALKKLGRAQEAEPLLREAVARQIEAAGEEHPDTLAAMANLASTLASLDRLKKGEELLRRVVAARRRTLGDHPSTYIALHNLATNLHDQGRDEEAEKLAREVVQSMAGLMGPEHTLTLTARTTLAVILTSQGRYDEAEAIHIEILRVAEKKLPAGHHVLLMFQRNYGRCLSKMGRYAEAEKILLQSYQGLRDRLGEDHEQTTRTRELVAELYQDWGKPERAAAFQQ